MKKFILALASLGIVFGAIAAHASPESDRMKVVNFLEHKYPDIKFDDYVYGALAFDPDAKSQYDSIMDFPPFLDVIDQGKKMWETPFKNGKTYAECMPNGGKMIAGNYPMYDEKLGKVVTFEDLINQCRVKNGEQPYSNGDMKTMGVLTSYARTLSDGMKMNIKVDSPGAVKAFDNGKNLFYKRHGQLNFACASCHLEAAGNRLRSEILSPVVGQAVHFPVFRGGSNLVTLQERFVGCFKMIRQVPDQPGSTRFNDLEYFMSYMSNGLPLHASVFRK
ncbi:MAG TPA: sulfur oxidation c-type cytochrome SoxA [Parasulfuritortus sp.]